MIPIGSLRDDYYMLDEDNYQVKGRRYGRCYKLGYPVTIRVKGVDMFKKQIDFELVDDETPDNEANLRENHGPVSSRRPESARLAGGKPSSKAKRQGGKSSAKNRGARSGKGKPSKGKATKHS